nr:hypothetical protein [Bacillus atrophaeus]
MKERSGDCQKTRNFAQLCISD